MPKAATGFYAVCKGREVGVFTSWIDHDTVRGILELQLNGVCVCRDETQTYVQGFPGAKFKKFKTLPEADRWYRSNRLQYPANPQTTTATPSISTVTPPSIVSTSSSSTGPTRASRNQLTTPISKPAPQPISTAITTPAPRTVQPPRIAAPKNTTVDIVYSDGACRGNGGPRAVAGVGVWWAPDDPRNLSERCPGGQTNNRAELIAIARVLETVPQNSNTLIIRTDSQYSQKALTQWCLKWRANGWKAGGGKKVQNKELIDYILTLLETRHRSGQPVQFEYVKGHSGNVGNDGADALAVAGCNHPEIPDRDWVGLKDSHNLEQKMMADLTAGIDPDDFILSDEDLTRELAEIY